MCFSLPLLHHMIIPFSKIFIDFHPWRKSPILLITMRHRYSILNVNTHRYSNSEMLIYHTKPIHHPWFPYLMNNPDIPFSKFTVAWHLRCAGRGQPGESGRSHGGLAGGAATDPGGLQRGARGGRERKHGKPPTQTCHGKTWRNTIFVWKKTRNTY